MAHLVEAERIGLRNGIAPRVCEGIEPACQTDGIRFEITPDSRIVVSEVVVQPRSASWYCPGSGGSTVGDAAAVGFLVDGRCAEGL
jgi:hypothetical protein